MKFPILVHCGYIRDPKRYRATAKLKRHFSSSPTVSHDFLQWHRAHLGLPPPPRPLRRPRHTPRALSAVVAAAGTVPAPLHMLGSGSNPLPITDETCGRGAIIKYVELHVLLT